MANQSARRASSKSDSSLDWTRTNQSRCVASYTSDDSDRPYQPTNGDTEPAARGHRCRSNAASLGRRPKNRLGFFLASSFRPLRPHNRSLLTRFPLWHRPWPARFYFWRAVFLFFQSFFFGRFVGCRVFPFSDGALVVAVVVFLFSFLASFFFYRVVPSFQLLAKIGFCLPSFTEFSSVISNGRSMSTLNSCEYS